jgi:hypothetical protein
MNFKKLLLTVTMVVIASGVMAENVDITVISSTSAQYPVGKKLSEDTLLNLSQGEKVVISIRTHEKARQVTFQGPYLEEKNGKKEEGSIIKTVKTIFTPSRTRTTSPDEATRQKLNEPWIAIVGLDEVFCLQPDNDLQFWRNDAQKESAIFIKGFQSLAENQEQPWKAAENTFKFSWQELPNGGKDTEYHVFVDGQKEPTVVYPLPREQLRSPTYMAKWMLENQCLRQAEILLDVKDSE